MRLLPLLRPPTDLNGSRSGLFCCKVMLERESFMKQTQYGMLKKPLKKGYTQKEAPTADSAQKPPTEAQPTRQHYNLATEGLGK